MAQRACAKKALRQSKVRRQRNRSVRTRLGTETRMFLRAVERRDAQEAKSRLSLLTTLLHRAAAKGIMHANTVARRQSLLQKRLTRIEPAA